MVQLIVVIILTPLAAWVALPAIVDLAAAIRGWRGGITPGAPRMEDEERLVFLIPAHDEGLLIERCVKSLLSIDYPERRRRIVVIADNCRDDTVSRARLAGAEVLERTNAELRGKGHAIAWALHELREAEWDAVIVIDADTIVLPNFGRELSRWSPFRGRAIQTYDTASNEFETWLTRLAGVLARSRYEVALPLKEAVGLSCPMTGDGIVLGRDLLARFPWQAETITEGWEWYARLTLAGVRVEYASRPIVFAQETSSLDQSGTQRSRWTSGRLEVFRLYRARILTGEGISLLQRLDLVAELTSLGPVIRGVSGLSGGIACVLVGQQLLLPGLLFLLGVVQPALYGLLALRRHPEPGRTLLALLLLPGYAVWRVGLALRLLFTANRASWVRTARRPE